MAQTRIPPIEEFPQDGQYWRVDWLASIRRNPNVPTDPYFQVVISPFKEDPLAKTPKELASLPSVDSDRQKTIYIGVGQLPLITIGSVWRDGYCLDLLAGEVQSYPALGIFPENMQVIAANHKLDGKNLIPFNYYRYGKPGVYTTLLAIEWNGDPFGILIPVMEVLRFYYAVSSNLCHAIFSGALRHDLSSLLNLERTQYLEEEDRLVIGLRQQILDIEGWFLGRMLCSDEAYEACCHIHDKLMRDTLNGEFAQVETGFPFHGFTNLKARVKPILSPGDGEWRHLVLSLDECSAAFPFEKLTVIRDNDGNKADPATDRPDKSKKPIARSARQKDAVNNKGLQSRREPNKSLSLLHIEIPTDRFKDIRGKKPDKPTKEQCEFKCTASPIRPVLVDELGTGLGGYSAESEGVQPVNVAPQRSRRKAISQSFMVFEEAVARLNTSPDVSAIIRELDASTAFIPLTKPEGYGHWSYLDSSIKLRRQVIAADIILQEKYHYLLVEFELRKSDKCTVALIGHSMERISNRYLYRILLSVAREKGVWGKIASFFDIEFATLKHTWSDANSCSASVENKLKLCIAC